MPKTLIAVSGGRDSMILLHHLCEQYSQDSLAVAHCNYQLRGEESDEDERFVLEQSEHYGLRCFSKRFDTEAYATEQGLSIQEAARELRYAWFDELMTAHGYAQLATAHHLEDSIETFFINLLRGTGPRGLAGIGSREGLYRPLLDWSSYDMQSYAQRHAIAWREDSSNRSSKYLRNRVRHELTPLLRDMRPGFDEVMQRNMAIQADVAGLLDEAVADFKQSNCTSEGENLRIALDGRSGEQLILYSMLSVQGFNKVQLENVLGAGQSGKQVYSHSHVLTSHRGGLILSPLQEVPQGEWQIGEDLDSAHLPVELDLALLDHSPAAFENSRSIAYLDREKLTFPLTLRFWREGDRFKPLGMRGTKKLSDFLVDIGVPRYAKNRVMVLESEGEIAWVVGHRISEIFKCKDSTTMVTRFILNGSLE